jgi:hypothetical protein
MLIVKEYIKNNEKKLSSFKKIRIAKHSNLTKKFYQDTTKLTQYTNDLIDFSSNTSGPNKHYHFRRQSMFTTSINNSRNNELTNNNKLHRINGTQGKKQKQFELNKSMSDIFVLANNNKVNTLNQSREKVFSLNKSCFKKKRGHSMNDESKVKKVNIISRKNSNDSTNVKGFQLYYHKKPNSLLNVRTINSEKVRNLRHKYKINLKLHSKLSTDSIENSDNYKQNTSSKRTSPDRTIVKESINSFSKIIEDNSLNMTKVQSTIESNVLSNKSIQMIKQYKYKEDSAKRCYVRDFNKIQHDIESNNKKRDFPPCFNLVKKRNTNPIYKNNVELVLMQKSHADIINFCDSYYKMEDNNAYTWRDRIKKEYPLLRKESEILMNNNNKITSKQNCNKTKMKLFQTMNKINTLIITVNKEFHNVQNRLLQTSSK